MRRMKTENNLAAEIKETQSVKGNKRPTGKNRLNCNYI